MSATHMVITPTAPHAYRFTGGVLLVYAFDVTQVQFIFLNSKLDNIYQNLAGYNLLILTLNELILFAFGGIEIIFQVVCLLEFSLHFILLFCLFLLIGLLKEKSC